MEAGAGACRHLFGKSGGGNARTIGPARRRGGTGRSGLGAGTAGVTAATFHSAALHQLNSVWADICEAPFPHVIEDQRDVVSRAIIRATARTDADPLTVRDVLAEINWAKISLVAVEDYARACAIAHRQPPAGLDTARFADVYSAYEQEKTSRGEIDFDDILLLVCHIMDGFPKPPPKFVPPSAGSPSTSIRTSRPCNTGC